MTIEQKEAKKLYNKNYYDKERRKQYYEANIAKSKEHYQNNKAKIKEQQNERKDEINKIRRESKIKNPIIKIKSNIRSNISHAMKRSKWCKISKTELILGCNYKELKLYLESKFESWMNWDNYGLYNGTLNYGWDIDHIIPTSSAKTIDELICLNHYTNLKPLCSKINRDIKRDNLV